MSKIFTTSNVREITDEWEKGEISYGKMVELLNQIAIKHISDAMMYTLDEDGHTGDWKIKFVDDYCKKLLIPEIEEEEEAPICPLCGGNGCSLCNRTGHQKLKNYEF